MYNSSDFENDNKHNNNSKLYIESLIVEQPQYEQIKESKKKNDNLKMENDFCFIYLTTNEEITKIIQFKNSGCLVVDRETTANFF
jgi:hypothetical protein